MYSSVLFICMGLFKKGSVFPSPILFVENPSRDLSPRAHSRGAEEKYALSGSALPGRQDCSREPDGCIAGEEAEQLPLTFQCAGHRKKMRKGRLLGCLWSSL